MNIQLIDDKNYYENFEEIVGKLSDKLSEHGIPTDVMVSAFEDMVKYLDSPEKNNIKWWRSRMAIKLAFSRATVSSLLKRNQENEPQPDVKDMAVPPVVSLPARPPHPYGGFPI